MDTSHRNRDIGWNHGEIVDGNRFHWMCNWCGLIRYGGGVSRLKKHLAGACHVKKCPNVPDDIAKSIMHHLMEKQKNRAKRSIRCSGIDGTELNNSHNNAIDHRDRAKSSMEMQVACAGRFSKKSTNRSKNIKIGTQISNSASQHSKTTARLPRTGMTKVIYSSYDLSFSLSVQVCYMMRFIIYFVNPMCVTCLVVSTFFVLDDLTNIVC